MTRYAVFKDGSWTGVVNTDDGITVFLALDHKCQPPTVHRLTRKQAERIAMLLAAAVEQDKRTRMRSAEAVLETSDLEEVEEWR